MVEQFFWKILLIVLAVFASPVAFSASYFLQMHELSGFLSQNEMLVNMGLESILYGVANVPLMVVSAFQGSGLICAALLLVISIVCLGLYIWWMDKRGKIWLESRRLHKSILAMDVIFAFVLFFAGYVSLKESMGSSLYSSVIIFILSLVAMLKFKNKIPLFVYLIIAIGITYFLM